MTERLLRIGEFAKLCKTTRDTILYYEKKGVLKPRFIFSSGYRAYAYSQVLEYELITILKMAGSSIEEISDFLNKKEPGPRLDYLKARLEALESELKTARDRISLLKGLIGKADFFSHLHPDCVTFARSPSKKIEYLSFGSNRPSNTKQAVTQFIESISSPLKDRYVPPAGYVLKTDDILKDKIFICGLYFTSKAGFDLPVVRLPAGACAVLRHKGSLSSHFESARSLLASACLQWGKTDGVVYLEDIGALLAWPEERSEFSAIAYVYPAPR